ncbi:hypothetical protein GCM10009760_06970 [Kitasatospora kazusensis]|uniref:CdiI immunity protein domain-containing protein n=1 Tax=Kitasatospora kazusensis TaxID=407974 RepID=A0ABP5KKM4_9ACTN
MTEHLTEFDFGLTGLTTQFHSDWTGTPQEIIERCADSSPAAHAILEDVLRLLESPLPTWAITVLWQAATGREFDLAYLGIDGRDWLHQIVDVCTERVRRDDPAFVAATPPPAPNALTGAVLDELLAAGPALTTSTMSRDSCEVSGVVPALELVITQVSPDLGFRLFLRAMARYWVPINSVQYNRFIALGELFGYGDFHVNDVQFLLDVAAD